MSEAATTYPAEIDTNPHTAANTTDAERAEMLAGYLDLLADEFGATPKLMPLDAEGKQPIIKDTCLLDTEQAREYLTGGDEAVRQIREDGHRGFAIYGGKPDHNTEEIVLVDVDDRETFPYENFPATLMVLSGSARGEHFTYRNAGDVSNARGKDGVDGEVRAKNWYCVTPGSIHPSGGVYHIHEGRDIATLHNEDIPTSLRPATDDDTTIAAVDHYDPDPSADVKAVIRRNTWIANYLAGLLDNPDRSKKDFAACRAFAAAGVSESDAREALANSSASKVGSADASSSYWSKTWTNALAKEAAESDDADDDRDRDDGDDDDDGWHAVKQLFDSSTAESTTRGYGEAAKLLCDAHDFVSIRETGELYYFNPECGYYVRKGETFIAELLEEYIPGFVNSSRRSNIHEIVTSRSYISADDFNPPTGKVAVENGVLDLDTRELEPHSPEYYFTNALPGSWDPDAEAPRWESFLDDAVTDEEARKLEEFIGYCLEVGHHNREKNLLIVGPRQSGKSTFADTVQALFGDMPTVSNLTPQQIADTQFDAAALSEAALNYVNDINSTKIEDSGTLKRVWSGERMKLERKFHDPTFGGPNAKHMHTANWLPTVVSQDESLYRRVLIVEFPNKVDDDEKDLNLKSDLKDELPGILVRALDARDRLHEQDGFTNDRGTTETRKKWDSWLDAHKRFLYTQFEITGNSDDVVDKEAYYRAYKEYAGQKGYSLKPKQGVTKSLQWVPEIDVGDDSYAGLQWDDGDAAEDDPSSPAESDTGGGSGSGEATQADLPSGGSASQDELTRKVLRWIDSFQTPRGAGKVEHVLDHAEEQGYDRDRVADRINTLCSEGRVYAPAEGRLLTTS